MIKFIIEETKQKLTFGMVEENQFFVDRADRLMQKISEYKANRISNSDGTPCADDGYVFDEYEPIKKLFPRVIKIEFDDEK